MIDACKLTLPNSALQAALAGLVNGKDLQIASGVAGEVSGARCSEFVVPRLVVNPGPQIDWSSLSSRQVPFLMRLGEAWRDPAECLSWLQNYRIDIEGRRIGLISVSPQGQTVGWIYEPNARQWVPFSEFSWPGPMMGLDRQGPDSIFNEVDNSDDGPDSRLAGALSKAGLARLRSMRFAVVGVSRVGSLVAHTLARWGVMHITLIDMDVVEPHNADCGEFDANLDEGRKKVAVVAKSIRKLLPAGARVETYDQSILSALAFSACSTADCIISCVDDDGARLIAATLANSYLRVHLDIGTQVTRDEGGKAIAGADVRLLLPSDQPRCLNCFGGFAQSDALRRLGGIETAPPPKWNILRAGSLRTVNQIAAHAGLRLIERLVNGDVSGSTWLRYEEAVQPSLREIVPARPWRCPICANCHGIGDAILDERDLRIKRLARAIVKTIS